MAGREGFEPSERGNSFNTLAGCRIKPALPPPQIYKMIGKKLTYM